MSNIFTSTIRVCVCWLFCTFCCLVFMQVSTNGYFSMGIVPKYSSLAPFYWFTADYSVVAPFAADIDTSSWGVVQYTTFFNV